MAEEEAGTQLHVRELSDLEPKAIAGTSGARHPFFSPDGQWVGFFADGALQRVSVAGGAPLRICNVSGLSMGGSWGPDGTIVFAARGTGLIRSVRLGVCRNRWRDPISEPGQKFFLIIRRCCSVRSLLIATIPLNGGKARVLARTNDSSSDSSSESPAVLGAGYVLQPRFVSSGYLVYGQSPGVVRAIPFDLVSLI